MNDDTIDSSDEPTVLTDLTADPDPGASNAPRGGDTDATDAGDAPTLFNAPPVPSASEAATMQQDAVSDAPTMQQDAVSDAPTMQQDAVSDAQADTGQGPLAPASVRAGDVFAGRYRLEQQLAQRGGTLTWRAFDQKLSRSVLVHILAPRDPRTVSVLDAARQAAVATDSRFLRVLDAVGGDDPEQPALVVCEYAPGQSLEQLLSVGPLSALEAAWVVRELSDAMGAMHEVGLFHQRLNPDTVIITATGNVKIVGFLIEAALHPEEADRLPWAQREAADVRALGKLLYASLVSNWPADAPGDPTWGLPAAPTDGRGWVMPRELNPAASPALDAVCDQVLSASPRLGESTLTSAKQVTQALSRVLGTADAAPDLERRMRFPMTPVRPSTQAAMAAGRQAVGGPGSTASGSTASGSTAGGDPEATAQWDAPAQFAREDAARAASDPRHTGSDASRGGDAATSGSDDGGQDGGRPDIRQRLRRWRGKDDDESDDSSIAPDPTLRKARRRPTGRAVDAGRHRLVFVLVALVLISLVVGLAGLLFAHPFSNNNSATNNATSAASGTAWTITAAKDFDPTADGGNGTENPSQTALAHDGNTATAWQTVTYLNSAKLGKLKPGVGLVLDLGESRHIGSVKLTLQGQPTAVQVRVPTNTSVTSAPMGSNSSWRVIASNAAAGTSVTLTPSETVSSRFVLIYLTSLPKVGTNKYRGGIAEVQVLS